MKALLPAPPSAPSLASTNRRSARSKDLSVKPSDRQVVVEAVDEVEGLDGVLVAVAHVPGAHEHGHGAHTPIGVKS